VRAGVREFAELFVALTSSDTKKAEVSAALARKSTEALSNKYQKKAADLWEEANKQALALLLPVLQNNPGKSKSDILARPDVRASMRKPYEQAAVKIEALLREGWAASAKDAEKKVRGEFKLLGEEWAGYDPDPDLLESLVADVHANAKAMRPRLTTAMTSSSSPSSAIRGRAADGRNRAILSTHMAVWGSATQVRESAFAKAGLNKMWLSRLDDQTCTYCKDLHGTVVGPTDSFPVAPGLKIYQTKLLGPPRHPRCRCVVVGTRLKKTKKNAA
jgi:hypothetical protein